MRHVFFILPFLLFSSAAVAQESAVTERMERLERDVNFLQRQVYRSEGGTATVGTAGGGAAASGQLAVRMAQIEEEMRQLRGTIEQSQFAARQNTDTIKKLSEDVDYRLQALEQAQQANAAAATAAVADPVAAPVEPAAEPVATVEDAPATYQKADASTKAATTGRDFPDSNAHYNSAFKLLNEKNYSAAAASFDAFVKKYPSDPLASNAYYWLGESYYARGDFTRAAEGFRKGFESNPEGQKAPDNLLKLAMSLGQVKRTNEACVVLKQVAMQYTNSAPRTAARAAAERTTMQCK